MTNTEKIKLPDACVNGYPSATTCLRRKKVLLAGLLLSCCATAFAGRELPHVEHVKRWLGSGSLNSKVAACKGLYMASGDDVECWAAHAARDIKLLPSDTQALILADPPERNAAMARCVGLSIAARLKDRQCAAAGQADTFISLRLPRMKLEAVKF